jgi:hypothetical protein
VGIGSWVYQLRRTCANGPRASFYREVVRRRILRTPPIEGLTDARCDIHVLTSREDWLNLIWTLKSFYAASGRNYKLCIHDDGTLDQAAKREVSRQFPDARLIDSETANREVLLKLEAYPRCRTFRQTNLLAKKVFDFRHYLQSERLLLLDSDVLFFSAPSELLHRLEAPEYVRNSVNADVASALTVDSRDVRNLLGLELPERFNSGLGVIHGQSLRLDWIEEFLGLPGVLNHSWRIEQTLLALCSARWGVELLPNEYCVSLKPGVGGCVAKHYVGAVRHLMYSEGIAQLARQGLLKSRFQPRAMDVVSAS